MLRCSFVTFQKLKCRSFTAFRFCREKWFIRDHNAPPTEVWLQNAFGQNAEVLSAIFLSEKLSKGKGFAIPRRTERISKDVKSELGKFETGFDEIGSAARWASNGGFSFAFPVAGFPTI